MPAYGICPGCRKLQPINECSYCKARREMVRYVWKAEEIGWAMAVAGIIFVFELLSHFEMETVTDWKTWGVVALGGLVRAVFGAGLAKMRGSGR